MRERILLNISFLLPVVGVRVRGVEGLLEKLWIMYRKGEVEVYQGTLRYTSLLKALELRM
ncbi:MAG: hypothetical protein QXQ57_01580 [Sulfolobales archaeon]